MTNEEYHKSDALNFSSLVKLLKSPAHYKQSLIAPIEQTKAMAFGSAVHLAVLEPEKFKAAYCVQPKINKTTKLGKIEFEDWCAENTGKKSLDIEDTQKIIRIVESINNHPIASQLLTKGVAEKSVFWKDPISDVLCRCRPDYWRDDGVIIDLKTADDASVDGFKRSIATFNYHLQSSWYLEGVGATVGKCLSEFCHLVIEKTEPFAIAIYTLDDVSLAAGSDKIRELLELYTKCKQENYWPAYSPNIQNIRIQPWLLGELR